MFAKVAEEGYMVTNVSSQIILVKTAIEYSNIEPVSTPYLIKKVRRVCLLAAKHLGFHYPLQNIIGFDIGLDGNAHVWIIEANFEPSMKPFGLLKERAKLYDPFS